MTAASAVAVAAAGTVAVAVAVAVCRCLISVPRGRHRRQLRPRCKTHSPSALTKLQGPSCLTPSYRHHLLQACELQLPYLLRQHLLCGDHAANHLALQLAMLLRRRERSKSNRRQLLDQKRDTCTEENPRCRPKPPPGARFTHRLHCYGGQLHWPSKGGEPTSLSSPSAWRAWPSLRPRASFIARVSPPRFSVALSSACAPTFSYQPCHHPTVGWRMAQGGCSPVLSRGFRPPCAQSCSFQW